MPEENIPIQENVVAPEMTDDKSNFVKPEQTYVAPQTPSQLSKPLKIILGIATFWPIFYIAMCLLFFFSFIIGFLLHGDAPGGKAYFLTPLLFILSIFIQPNTVYIVLYFTITLAFILPFIYIINVFKNEEISKNKKTWWTIVFSLGILFIILLLAFTNFTKSRNDVFYNIMYSLGIFIFAPYIAMPVFWYSHICKERRQNQSSRTRFRYIYIPILYAVILLSFPSAFVMDEVINSVQGANLVKKRESLINAPGIKVYMPTALGNEWSITVNNLSSDNGLREIEYLWGSWGGRNKRINIEEIKNSKTDLKCNNETFTEINDIFPKYSIPLSDELWWMPSDEPWMNSCEELSISGEKSVLYHEEKRRLPNTVYNRRYFVMVFDKGSTRILLYYVHYLEDSLLNTEGWSKSELIKVAESLRPVN